MKWLIAIVLCFVFPWVGVPMLLWFLFPTIISLVAFDRALGKAVVELGDRKSAPMMNDHATDLIHNASINSSISDIIAGYLASITCSEIEQTSGAAACELMERCKSSINEASSDGKVLPSVVLSNLTEVRNTLPPGSFGRAVVLSFTLETLKLVSDVSLRSEAIQSTLKVEGCATIAASIRWYSRCHGGNSTIEGLDALYARVDQVTSDQDVLIRTLCGLNRINPPSELTNPLSTRKKPT